MLNIVRSLKLCSGKIPLFPSQLPQLNFFTEDQALMSIAGILDPMILR
eukprot:SAG31_NODE_4482_length_3197_cov_2.463202_4_plen_48_part_00